MYRIFDAAFIKVSRYWIPRDGCRRHCIRRQLVEVKIEWCVYTKRETGRYRTLLDGMHKIYDVVYTQQRSVHLPKIALEFPGEWSQLRVKVSDCSVTAASLYHHPCTFYMVELSLH